MALDCMVLSTIRRSRSAGGTALICTAHSIVGLSSCSTSSPSRRRTAGAARSSPCHRRTARHVPDPSIDQLLVAEVETVLQVQQADHQADGQPRPAGFFWWACLGATTASIEAHDSRVASTASGYSRSIIWSKRERKNPACSSSNPPEISPLESGITGRKIHAERCVCTRVAEVLQGRLIKGIKDEFDLRSFWKIFDVLSNITPELHTVNRIGSYKIVDCILSTKHKRKLWEQPFGW